MKIVLRPIGILVLTIKKQVIYFSLRTLKNQSTIALSRLSIRESEAGRSLVIYLFF